MAALFLKKKMNKRAIGWDNEPVKNVTLFKNRRKIEIERDINLNATTIVMKLEPLPVKVFSILFKIMW